MRVAFNDLPATVRERFIAVARDPRAPGALLSNSDGHYQGLLYFFTLAAIAGSLYTIDWLLDRHDRHVKPHSDIEVYLLLAGFLLVLAPLACTIVYRWIWPLPPYRSGAFLFPSALVLTRDTDLEIIPTRELAPPIHRDNHNKGHYVATWLNFGAAANRDLHGDFFAGTRERANVLASDVALAQLQWAHQLAAGDPAAEQDPFHPCIAHGRWSDPETAATGPRVAVRPGYTHALRWLITLLLPASVKLFYDAMY
jgi:hypothetical protein